MTDAKRRPKRFKFSSEGSGSSSASSSVTSSSSSDEETDANDLKPIKDYISNRKEMASQLFKSVKAEKIRLMLPQTLKKVEFSDLEELCTNELIGMSKTRILSIVNGQEMLQSSDTEDSDGSGPSLEIVSDTDWLSADENIGIKVEGKKKNKEKKNRKVQDQNIKDVKTKLKSKEKGKGAKVKLEKVKTEGKDKAKNKEKEKVKDKAKEGESLLDLLELEMRARAIRALIRKEEDASKVVQSNGASTDGTNNSNEQNTKTRHANLKEQLEKIDVLMKHGEDEDVYVVINPAPTIELLSSDSDNENSSKRRKKFDNERKSEAENLQNKDQPSTSKDNDIGVNKDKDVNQENVIINNAVNEEKENNKESDKVEKSKEKDNMEKPKEKDKTENLKEKDKAEKIKERESKNDNLPMSVIENNSNDKIEDETKKESDLEEGEILDDEDDIADNTSKEDKITEQPPSKNIKKIKKNPHIRPKKKSKDSDEESIELNTPKSNEKETVTAETKENKNKSEKIDTIEIEESPERPKETDKIINVINDTEESSSKIDLFDYKSLDIEEIINLDDYPDDMDDLEKSKSNVQEKKSEETHKNSGSDETQKQKSETWATRYYQQDDVQSVIKESKIQSEIRKRLRERQRRNKLNNSPNLSQEPPQASPQEIAIPKPTGSVEEYLALKGQSSSHSEEKIKVIGPDNSATESSNDSLQTESTVENTNSSIQSDAIVNQSIVIVKKAKLNENLCVVKKIDTSTLDVVASIERIDKLEDQSTSIEMKDSSERPEEIEKIDDSKDNKEESSIEKHENLPTSGEESHEKQKDSPTSDTDEGSKKENPEAVCFIVDEETSALEETSAEKKDYAAEAGPTSPRCHSGEDNAVVNTGSRLTTSDEQTDQATSELRPD